MKLFQRLKVSKTVAYHAIYKLENDMKLTKDVIQRMMRSIQTTYEKELSCSECYEEIDRFAEIELSGKNPIDAMPLVQQHLDRCSYCKEEYEALLDALRILAG